MEKREQDRAKVNPRQHPANIQSTQAGGNGLQKQKSWQPQGTPHHYDTIPGEYKKSPSTGVLVLQNMERLIQLVEFMNQHIRDKDRLNRVRVQGSNKGSSQILFMQTNLLLVVNTMTDSKDSKMAITTNRTLTITKVINSMITYNKTNHLHTITVDRCITRTNQTSGHKKLQLTENSILHLMPTSQLQDHVLLHTLGMLQCLLISIYGWGLLYNWPLPIPTHHSVMESYDGLVLYHRLKDQLLELSW